MSQKASGNRAAMMLLGVNGIGTLCILADYFALKPKLAQNISRFTMSVFMILAGVAHFDPQLMSFYLNIMPPILPYQEELIYLSGVFEVAAGALSLLPPTRNIGAWLTIATLLGVFPANIYMAMSKESQKRMGATQAQSNFRLVLQFIMLYMAYMYTDQHMRKKGKNGKNE